MSGVVGIAIVAVFTALPVSAAFDLAAADQSSVSDAVFLVEATGTDGSLTVTSGLDLVAFSSVAVAPVTVAGGSVNLDWSDVDWTSSPTDTRPNVHFEGRAGEITIDRALPLRPDGARRVAVAVSDIAISNADGAWDDAARLLAVDGQPVAVSILQSRASAYSTRRTVFSGIGLDWRADLRALQLRARDLTYALDTPMLGTYAGTGGANGGADLKGKVIPEVWGFCRGVAPVPMGDASLQIYQVHARQVDGISNVYVRGAEVTAGALQATYAALAAASVTAGTYDWAITATGSYIRIGSAVDGTVTANVRGDASAGYTTTIGGMMRRILARAGVAFSAPGFAALDLIVPSSAGCAFFEDTTYAEALNRIAASGFFWWGDDGAGVITAGRVAPPFGEGGAPLDETVIVGEVERLDDPAIAWRVTAGYQRNWSPLAGTDIATGLTDARRKQLAEERRTTIINASARRSRNAQAEEVIIETLVDSESAAQAIATDVINLMKPGLNIFRVPCNAYGMSFALGQNARLTWPRFGLANGLEVRVIGQAIRGRRVDLLVLG